MRLEKLSLSLTQLVAFVSGAGQKAIALINSTDLNGMPEAEFVGHYIVIYSHSSTDPTQNAAESGFLCMDPACTSGNLTFVSDSTLERARKVLPVH